MEWIGVRVSLVVTCTTCDVRTAWCVFQMITYYVFGVSVVLDLVLIKLCFHLLISSVSIQKNQDGQGGNRENAFQGTFKSPISSRFSSKQGGRPLFF